MLRLYVTVVTMEERRARFSPPCAGNVGTKIYIYVRRIETVNKTSSIKYCTETYFIFIYFSYNVDLDLKQKSVICTILFGVIIRVTSDSGIHLVCNLLTYVYTNADLEFCNKYRD